MAAASILAAGVGGSYVLWGPYGDQLEQAVMASVRTSATWLQQIRSNDWLASPKAAATVEKIVESQQTEAAYVTNVPQNARKDEPTSPTVAHPTPEGSAPKPGNGSIESERGSQGLSNLGSPSTSSATELSPSPTRRGEPDTKSQLPRTNALDKTVTLNEIPPTKPTPPDTQPAVSSATIPRSVIAEYGNLKNHAPPAPSAPQVVSIDPAGLVSRGDQLLGMRDVTSARLFYERAAQAGDGQAALRMGMTFDPVFLERSGIRGAQGDPARAISWYDRAAALGNTTAEELKSILTGRTK